METFTVSTPRRQCMIDVTREIDAIVRASDVGDGACLVFVPHTTAGVTINENADPDVTADMEKVFTELVPAGAGYAHAEGNSDSHVKSTLVGPSLLVPVEEGRLLLGTWQGVYFCEFDGPRQRRCMVKMMRS